MLKRLGLIDKKDGTVWKYVIPGKDGIMKGNSFSLWLVSTQGEDEPDAAKCVGCFLTTGLVVTQKQQPSLSDQEPRTTASQPAINRSWATSKAL